MKDESEIIGQALTEELGELVNRQILENDISPLVIVRALLTVAGNVRAAELIDSGRDEFNVYLAESLDSLVDQVAHRLESV